MRATWLDPPRHREATLATYLARSRGLTRPGCTVCKQGVVGVPNRARSRTEPSASAVIHGQRAELAQVLVAMQTPRVNDGRRLTL
jgi:hypothetical protein